MKIDVDLVKWVFFIILINKFSCLKFCKNICYCLFHEILIPYSFQRYDKIDLL